jgi:predicted CXXCH cytochrome family protein
MYAKDGPAAGENQGGEMKVAKVTFLVVMAALVAAGVSTTAHSFHSGGVAECEGCHSMHSPKAGGSRLLVGSDASSTCLSCHEVASDTGPNGYHVSTADSALATGAPKQRHGHNIVALDQLYAADDNNVYAPGGGTSFSAAQLGCQSCHDPHGQTRRTLTGYQRGGTLGAAVLPIMASGSYNNSPNPTATEAVGVYRILRGAGDSSQGVTFSANPIAVAPSSYNQSEAANQVRVAYGASGTDTWGNWCGTCHADMHASGGLVHPVDESLSDVAQTYNAYVKSGDLSGAAATSFSSLVPFAEASGDYTVLKTHASNTGGYLNGPASGDKVMCLSCHRAHASGMPEALRYSQTYEFMTYGANYVGMDNPLMTSSRKRTQSLNRNMADWQQAYYGRPASQFATYQRVLCNKCHAKD